MKTNPLNSNNEFISLYTETKAILKENGVFLNKNLGQNYLIDDFKRKKIINFANLDKDDTVLEIGPGIGTLSLEIAKKVNKVIAIEKDNKIAKILKNRIKNEEIDNIEVIEEDALKIEFPKFNKIVSNLPYQISSPITFKFLKYKFDYGILMYQKEFATRMKSKVGTKSYSRLTAMLHFTCNIEYLDELSPNVFIPQPKVNSSLIKLIPKEEKEEYKLAIINNQYKMICKALFQHKNKNGKNALIDSRHELNFKDKKELRNILEDLIKNNEELNSYLSRKVISLSPEEIYSLTLSLKDIIKI